MNKISVKEGLLLLLCFAVAMGIRIFSMTMGEAELKDDFHYYEDSVIQEEVKEPVFTSGVAFAYTESLSRVLKFAGNRPFAVVIYHMILQAAAFWLFFFGCRMLFEKTAAFLLTILFSLSPGLIAGIWQCSPESFYLFWWSLLLFLIGIFAMRTKGKGWYRCNLDELFFGVTGILLGTVCVWHIAGILLVVLILYAIIVNFSYLSESGGSWRHSSILEDILKEEEGVKITGKSSPERMRIYDPIIISAGGMLFGGYWTLMKYTGISGYFLTEQFSFWKRELWVYDQGRWQDLFTYLPIFLIITVIAGAALRRTTERFAMRRREKADKFKEEKEKNTKEKKEKIPKEKQTKISREKEMKISNEKQAEAFKEKEVKISNEEQAETFKEKELRISKEEQAEAFKEKEAKISKEEQAEAFKEKEAKIFKENQEKASNTEEWATEKTKQAPEKKEIKYIENPLPIPKRHVKKTMDFEIEKTEDFDIDIDSNDDFDI